MKASLKPVIISNGVVALLCLAVAINTRGTGQAIFGNYLLIPAGLICLLMAVLNLIIGVIMAIAGEPDSGTKKTGIAFLLSGSILLLCSGTFCSMGILIPGRSF